MKKRNMVLLLLLLVAASFFACGKGERTNASPDRPVELSLKDCIDSREKLRYCAEEIKLPEGRRIDLICGLQTMGDRLVFRSQVGEQNQICSMDRNGSDFRVLVPNTRRIWGLCADGDRLYALVELEEDSLHPYLTVLDAQGQSLDTLDLAPEGTPESWNPFRFEVSGGRIYVLGTGRDGQRSLCVMDGETLLWCESCDTSTLVRLPDGRVLTGRSREGQFTYSRIDADAKAFFPLLTADLPLSYESGDENGLLFSYQGEAFRLAPDFSQPEKVLTAARTGLAIRSLLPDGEGFLCVDQEGRLYRLRPDGELAADGDSCILTIAVIAEVAVYPLDKYVLEWNQSHPDCLIEIKNYYVPTGIEGDPAGCEKGMDALVMDITTGSIPDIYLLGRDMEPMLLTRKGYLEDLYPYMDADPQMGRDAFYEPLLRAMEYRGGLYELPGWFYVNTCIARKSTVGGAENWNFETLNRLREKSGCQMLFLNNWNHDRMFELLLLTHLYSSKLIDWETGVCSFDSPLYIALLKAAAEFPPQEDPDYWQYGADLQAAPELPSALLQETWSTDCWVPPLNCWESYGTEDYVFLGYPELGTVFDAAGSLAISAYSLHKPECWDFIKFYVNGCLDGHEESFNVLSRNMEANYDRMIERASTKDAYWPDDVPWENLLEKFAGIEPLMREFMQQVDDCTAVLRQDRSIDKIVQTEAARYFAGETSAEQCAANIQSRARIYLAEQG